MSETAQLILHALQVALWVDGKDLVISEENAASPVDQTEETARGWSD